MKLRDAVELTGEENLHLWLGWPDNFFTIEDRSTGLAWNVPADQMNGGWDAFEQFTLKGNGTVTLDLFSPEAVIGWITVSNEHEEE